MVTTDSVSSSVVPSDDITPLLSLLSLPGPLPHRIEDTEVGAVVVLVRQRGQCGQCGDMRVWESGGPTVLQSHPPGY